MSEVMGAKRNFTTAATTLAGGGAMAMIEPHATAGINLMDGFVAGGNFVFGERPLLSAFEQSTGTTLALATAEEFQFLYDAAQAAGATFTAIQTADGVVNGLVATFATVPRIAFGAPSGARAFVGSSLEETRIFPLHSTRGIVNGRLAPDLRDVGSNFFPPSQYTLVVHGAQDNTIQILHNGDWIPISHRTLANYMRRTGFRNALHNQANLVACYGGEGRYPQNLSNKLGVTVKANTGRTIFQQGGPYSGTFEIEGDWLFFNPGQ